MKTNKMKTILVVIAFLSMVVATNSWAAFSNSDSLTVANGGLAVSTLLPTNLALSWNVSSSVVNGKTQWTYNYTLSTPNSSDKPVMSLIDIEVLPGFSIVNNLISDTVSPYDTTAAGPATYNAGNNGIYGLQWDFNNYQLKNNTPLILTLVTNTQPMWGDIYIGGTDLTYYAKNTGFGPSLDNSNDIAGSAFFAVGGKTYGSVLVPSSTVPIPSAVLLLGSGLIGMLAVRRRFSK